MPTEVTSRDPDTGHTETMTITDDYVLVCDGKCYRANVQTYGSGTHVITVKGRAAWSKGGG